MWPQACRRLCGRTFAIPARTAAAFSWLPAVGGGMDMCTIGRPRPGPRNLALMRGCAYPAAGQWSVKPPTPINQHSPELGGDRPVHRVGGVGVALALGRTVMGALGQHHA
jgi:hypothetical protein